jgi:hypothetical protein
MRKEKILMTRELTKKQGSSGAYACVTMTTGSLFSVTDVLYGSTALA